MSKKRMLLVGLGLMGLAVLAGCQPPAGRSGGGTTIPGYMLSVSELGSKLGLSVSGGSPYYELKNANNRVLLFMYDNGRVYVNGQAVGAVGPVVSVNGTHYVSEILLPQIRPFLKSATPAWTPTPSVPSTPWTPKTGSGKVIVDAGHGGKDPGAISYLGYHEKEVNLGIARRLAAILQKRGVEVIMTRQGDTHIDKEERAAMANRAGADLFVSIHSDSNSDRIHQGFTVYIARSASEASRRLGRSIESALSRTGISSKGLRTADYVVLVKTSCPAVLVECGFLSNPSEAAMLLDGSHQDRIAAAIADGVMSVL